MNQLRWIRRTAYVFACMFCLLVPKEVSIAAEPGASGGAESASGPEKEVSLLLIPYVASVYKEDAWKEYEATVGRLYEDAEVLSRFGLATLEQAQLLAQVKDTASEGLRQAAESKQRAYAFLTGEAGSASNAEGTSVVPTDSNTGQPPERDLSSLEKVRQAIEREDEAYRQLVSSEVQAKSGLIAPEQLLAVRQTYLEAQLAAADAKEAYFYSVHSYLSLQGERVPLHLLLEEIGKDREQLAKEWLNILSRELSVPGTDGIAPFLPVRSERPSGSDAEGTVDFVPMVPIRPYAEALHFEVAWNAESGEIALSKDDSRISFVPGNRSVTVNGQTSELPVAPMVRTERIYVPLSFFETALGLEVYWNKNDMQGLIIP